MDAVGVFSYKYFPKCVLCRAIKSLAGGQVIGESQRECANFTTHGLCDLENRFGI